MRTKKKGSEKSNQTTNIDNTNNNNNNNDGNNLPRSSLPKESGDTTQKLDHTARESQCLQSDLDDKNKISHNNFHDNNDPNTDKIMLSPSCKVPTTLPDDLSHHHTHPHDPQPSQHHHCHDDHHIVIPEVLVSPQSRSDGKEDDHQTVEVSNRTPNGSAKNLPLENKEPDVNHSGRIEAILANTCSPIASSSSPQHPVYDNEYNLQNLNSNDHQHHKSSIKRDPNPLTTGEMASAVDQQQVINNHTFSLLLIGDEGTGKSALLRRFFQNTFTPQYMPTIGIDFLTSSFVGDSGTFTSSEQQQQQQQQKQQQQQQQQPQQQQQQVINLLLYDTSGSKKFQSLIPNYLRECSVCLLCFDLSNMDSYRAIFEVYLPTIHNRFGDNVILIAVGCKNDLTRQRVIAYEDIKARTKELSIPYLETSARTGFNVSLLFNQIAKILPEISPKKYNTHHHTTQQQNPPSQPDSSQTMSREGHGDVNNDSIGNSSQSDRPTSCLSIFKCW